MKKAREMQGFNGAHWCVSVNRTFENFGRKFNGTRPFSKKIFKNIGQGSPILSELFSRISFRNFFEYFLNGKRPYLVPLDQV